MIKITENAPLLGHNTFGMDVRAAMLAEYETTAELREILHMPRVRELMQQEREAGHLPFWHIGSGSNLLFRGDYPGVVLHCIKQGIRVAQADNGATLDYLGDDYDCLLEVDAGTTWDDVCAYCAENSLYGAENLSLIPGEMGAAAVQNIGAYGVEIKDLVKAVVTWDVENDCEHVLLNQEMQYGYRESLLKHAEAKQRYIVTSVLLCTQRAPRLRLEYAGLLSALGLSELPADKHLWPTSQQVRDAVIRIRQGKLPDPKDLGNAGSFFKNPVVDNSVFEAIQHDYPSMPHYKVDDTHTKIPAGWLIEQCGWKGRNLGKAGVYEKQSLVLVNRGGARPEEIVQLCETIIKDVNDRFGIMIEPEVNIIG